LAGHTVDELHIWAEPGERQLMLEDVDSPHPPEPLEVRFRTRFGKTLLVEVAAERFLLDDEPCILAIR